MLNIGRRNKDNLSNPALITVRLCALFSREVCVGGPSERRVRRELLREVEDKELRSSGKKRSVYKESKTGRRR